MQRLPGPDIYPPYLFLSMFFLIDFGLVNAYKMATGYQHIILKSPTVVAGPLGVLVAAFGIRYITALYEDAIRQLHARNQGAEQAFETLQPLIARRTTWAVYLCVVAVLYAVVVFYMGLETIIGFEGPAGLVNYLFVWQVGYMPFAVEFTLLYFSSHFGLPRRIAETDLSLFHYDPRNMGGFADIGQLLKRSYYVFTLGLILYFILTYGPFIFAIGASPQEPGLVEALFFSVAWLVGLLSIAYSMLRMHQVMTADKEAQLRALEAELQEAVSNPADIKASEITAQETFEDIQIRIEQVRATRVYPATFTMWSQIAISAVVPQALQLAVQAT